MLAEDLATDGEAEAGALGPFRANKRLEDVGELGGSDTDAVVQDDNPHPSGFGVEPRVDGHLRALAAILIQADKFGSSIAQALRVQSDSMRTRRRQLAEEKAAKTAVKLIFPLVIFIFPGIFVVLVGPAAITMVRELFPSMGAK